MGKQIPTTVSKVISGQEITLESGKLAALADGSVVLRHGDMWLLATAVSVLEAKPDQSFFPLTVEFREKFSAAGRIPGNFFKREARLSDSEILVCRLIDRVIRPMFPDGYMNETQIFVSLISGDTEIMADAYAAFAASAALIASEIPFENPISEVRVARIDGEFVINPTRSALETADMTFIVGGTMDNIAMVEGEADQCSEAELIDAIKFGHEAIKEQCQLQLDLREALGITENRPTEEPETNPELEAEVNEATTDKIYAIAKGALSKQQRKEGFSQIKEELKESLLEKYGEEYMEENGHFVSEYFYNNMKNTIREMVMAEKIRLDGRKPDEIRPIWCEVDSLPSPHGSSIFNRGETQALATVTLGSKLDQPMVDTAMDQRYDQFFLHYSFPPFCTNEVKRVGGVSRREVGHGNLARRSLEMVFPSDYPYTVRVTSDVLESNGSSSMASVCSGSMALMDAGVPIKAAVSGIAMGLISDGNRAVVLSDILGDEDHLGDMDFKVTGTAEGICACQMDIKIDGLDYDLLATALQQAREGRLHILNLMNETIPAHNEDLKPHAPRIIRYEIPGDKIGAVIGPGGKIIQGIQSDTGSTITIEEEDNKGIVFISGVGKDTVDAALKIIKGIAAEAEVGEEYDAKVVSIMPYGAFVEFMPGKEGLLHVSEISWARIENVEDAVAVGDVLKVKLLAIDERTGKYKLSRKVLMDKPEGYVERPRKPREDRGNNRNRNNKSNDRNRNNRNNK
ncbi:MULTISPECIES: polyribonucleotide nucleotidyltransferase [unclassified Aureispira]|uniref:polyribonucleotide nucleotidyltransferase n=1 Tax=unclassified Aureispira TaxID=2649989 RepID=UPI0006975018|nr:MULTISPECIES: polyribonucleotide nucleotidyltransferase [unclassified Aureispira]WMX13981.1 polyribonucleotide nucleotidyltransferase [Aureispira sp. CCB-E]